MINSIQAFNRTLEKTDLWLKELQETGNFDHKDQTYKALRAVLHSLRDRLTVNEAVHLASQLPMLVRGFYYEGWRPALAPNKEHTLDEFCASVDESLRSAKFKLDTEQTIRSVFKFLKQKISAGELKDIKAQLPKSLLGLWDE